jgi:hypothetical protein
MNDEYSFVTDGESSHKNCGSLSEKLKIQSTQSQRVAKLSLQISLDWMIRQRLDIKLRHRSDI